MLLLPCLSNAEPVLHCPLDSTSNVILERCVVTEEIKWFEQHGYLKKVIAAFNNYASGGGLNEPFVWPYQTEEEILDYSYITADKRQFYFISNHQDDLDFYRNEFQAQADAIVHVQTSGAGGEYPIHRFAIKLRHYNQLNSDIKLQKDNK